MNKEKIENIEKDDDIYPRQQVSHTTIKYYAESMKAGATFPPVIVQKIREEGDEKTIVVNGWHRIKAYERIGKEQVRVKYWKDERLDKEEHLEELILAAIKYNRKQGRNLLEKDIKEKARIIARNTPVDEIQGLNKRLAERLGFSEGRVSQWISNITTRKRGSRNGQIFKLSLLGWTQEEIGEEVGLSQNRVSEIIGKFNVKEIDNFYEREGDIKKTAEHFGLDQITAWAVVLQGKDDRERFELFGKEEYQDNAPRIYNVWRFSGPDHRLGRDVPGRIPGQIALNLLYYYTEQGDLVVDPMAGGGSTVDACLVMGRECRAYDIDPVRDDIIEHDLRKGFPKRTEGADLVFLDPPYWKLKREHYKEESVSNLTFEGWLEFMRNVIERSYDILDEEGKVTLAVEPVDRNGFFDLTYKCMKMFEEVGFKEVFRIDFPITTDVKSGRDVNYAKENKIMLNLNGDVLVYEK